MSDDVVQASPVDNNKRRRRRTREKSSKKPRGSNDSSRFETTAVASTNKTISEMSTISEESSGDVTPPAQFDVSLLYGSQLDEDEVEVGEGGIFAHLNLLERAALADRGRQRKEKDNKKKDEATKHFIAACDLPDREEDSCQITAPRESPQNASVVSDTQVLRLCEAADIIEDLKRSKLDLSSEWNSSGERAEPGPSGMSIMETMAFNSQDSVGQEILRNCTSQAISEPSQRSTIFPPPPQAEPHISIVPETYSGLKVKKQKDKQIARRLAEDYDFDSKSSQSSELSAQNCDFVESTPTDCDDLRKSVRACENPQNLKSFFSQSYTQKEYDTITDGIYRHIISLNAKKWEVRLFEWYNNERNFNFPDDNSSDNFEGFGSSEIESLQSECSYKSKDISSLLDDDDECFKEIRATYLANNMNQETSKECPDSMQGEPNNSEEECMARTSCCSKDNNFEILNRDNRCLSKNIDVDPKSKDILPGSPRESQIWPDEDLLYELSTPTINPNVTTKSFKELDNPKTDVNENNTKFIKSDLSGIRSFKEENQLPVSRPCMSKEKPVIALENVYKSEHKSADEINFKIPKGNTFAVGFQSARGKKIEISEKAMLKAKSLWAEVEQDLDNEGKKMSVDRHCPKSQSHSVSRRFEEKVFQPSQEVKKSIPNERNLNEDDHCSVRNLNESKGFTGFKLLSGKPILISKEAKERAGRILSDVDDLMRDEFKQDPIKDVEENIGSTGFKSVSVKPIFVAKEATNKTGEALNTFVQDGAKEDPLKSLEENRSFAGFKKVTGKSVTTPPASDDNLIRDAIDQNRIKDFEESTELTELKSVSGKIETISKEAANRGIKFFAEVDSFTHEEITQYPLKGLVGNKGFTDFKSASGKCIQVSEKAQNRASNLIFEVDAFIEESMRDEQKKPESTPSTSQSTMIMPSDRSYSNHLKELNSEKAKSKGTIPYSTTVFGKSLEKPSEDKTLAKQGLLTNYTGDEIKVMSSTSKYAIDETTSQNQKMYNRFNEKENITELASSSEIGIIRRQSLNLFSRGNSNKRPIGFCSEISPQRSIISTNLTDEKSMKRFKSNNYLSVPVKIPTSRIDVASMSSNFQKIYDGLQKSSVCEKFVTPVKTQAVFQHCETPDLKEFFNSVETSTPQKLKKKNNFSLTQEISASIAALEEDELKSSAVADDFHTIKWDDFEDSFNDKSQLDLMKEENKSQGNELPEKVLEIIIKNREAYRQKCEDIIKDKINHSSKICPGELYIKRAEKNRQKIRDLVGTQKPAFEKEEVLVEKGLLPEVARLTFLQAADFKFSEPLEGRTVIPIQENTFIIPDDYNKIGLNEIKRCFLTESGVYEPLLPRTWIDHHFKMILLKLAMLEKAFPQYFAKKICTPENIVKQLKYRYDREIDRAERSCLKKILESDDSPAKRMVLLVLDIQEHNGEMELELTDWWYSVRATVDLAMISLVKKGKVRIGTKLMIQGAKLLNCDSGFDPLEMPAHVRLVIHTNSCRRAVWYLKLGFFKDPKPFSISLDDIQENGGLISKLQLHILRVYPTVYLTRSGGSSQSIHSQKVEERLRKTEEKLDFDNFEMIFSQVQDELQKEKAAKRKRLNCSSVVNDPEELCKLIDEGCDLEDVEIDLSLEELNKVIKYNQEVSLRRMDEVNCRVREKLKEQSEKRSSTELIKIRVIDAKLPKSTAVLSIWRPEENLRELLKEGTSIEVTNCTPSGVRYGDMQLNSIKSSEFSFVSKKLTISEKPDLLRRVTTIKEICSSNFSPSFNEVDTFGFIVMITNVEQTKFQSVYLCDADENLLCVNFWNGVTKYAYEDVIQEGRFISACNLQARRNTKTGIIPCLFATEISIFTENPKAEYMSSSFTVFKNLLHEVDLTTLSSNCAEKIESLKICNVSGNSFSTPLRKSSFCGRFHSPFNNTFEHNSSGNYSVDKSPNIPTPQNRIDRLKVYGEPPDLPPITLEIKPEVRSAFKLPSNLGEQNQN